MKKKRTTVPTDITTDAAVRTLIGGEATRAKARKHAAKIREELAEARRKNFPVKTKSFEV